MDWVVGMQVVAPSSQPAPERHRAGWFLAYTNERAEERLVRCLKGKGIEAKHITERVERERYGKLQAVDAPLFPRYVFVDLAEEDFPRLRGTPGLESILRDGRGYPARLPDEMVSALSARFERGDFDHTSKAAGRQPAPRPGHQVGDRVEIVRGPWQSFIGTVERLEPHARVRMLVSLFGRSSSVSMPMKHLAPP